MYRPYITAPERIKFSLKYQVLCNLTAMIAVVKQKEKTTGELKEYNIPMGDKIRNAAPEPLKSL